MMGEPCGDQGRTTTGENAPVGGGVAHQQDENPEADEGDAEAHDEHHVEGAGEQCEQPEGDERPDQGTDGIERTVDPEGSAEPLSRGGERDHRIAGGGADALAGSVEQKHPGEGGPGPARGEEPDLADSRDRVADGGDILVPVPSVRGQPAADAQERARSLVEPVDQPETEWREV